MRESQSWPCIAGAAVKTPRQIVESRARRFRRIATKAGAPRLAPDVEKAIIERVVAREEHRIADRLAREELLAQCASVTATARALGFSRNVLFRWLEDAGWLRRVDGEWCATGQAIADVFVVERGPASIRWVQITPRGQVEIAQRLAVNPDTQSDE